MIQEDTLTRLERERMRREMPGKVMEKGVRMAGEALLTAFG